MQCFVANAVTTGLTQPRYGMTVAQFHDYGVSVTKILQSDQTYLVLVGLSSAIVNALPQKNADGTFNNAARDAAVVQIGRPSCSGRPAKQPQPSLFQVSQRSRDTRGHFAIVKLRRVVSTHRALSALGIRTSEIKIEMFIRSRLARITVRLSTPVPPRHMRGQSKDFIVA